MADYKDNFSIQKATGVNKLEYFLLIVSAILNIILWLAAFGVGFDTSTYNEFATLITLFVIYGIAIVGSIVDAVNDNNFLYSGSSFRKLLIILFGFPQLLFQAIGTGFQAFYNEVLNKAGGEINTAGQNKDDYINGLGIILSLVIYGLLIGYLVEGIEKNNKERIMSTTIILGILILISSIIVFSGFDIYVKTNTSQFLPKVVAPFALALVWVPYIIIETIVKLTNSIVGEPKKGGVETLELEGVGDKYSGMVNTIENLGKGDSGFTILGKIRMSKREGILPCNPYKGVCKVRRSVIYTIFYLTAILLVSFFIVLGDALGKGKGKDFNTDKFIGYVSSFLAATFGLVLILVLATVKDAAGSDLTKGVETRDLVETNADIES